MRCPPGQRKIQTCLSTTRYMTFRPQNECNRCKSTWHPRGKDLSSRCPSCGSRDVNIVRSSSPLPGCAPIVIGAIVITATFGWLGSHVHGSSSQPDSLASNPAEASAVAIAPVSESQNDAVAAASNSTPASETIEAASASRVNVMNQPDIGNESAITDSQPHRSELGLTKTFTTSFDCTQASDDDEIAVCGDPGLAAMDRQLGQLYDAAIKTTPNPQALEKSESDWLLARHMCNKDLNCLRHVYGERIGQFLGSIGSKPLIPATTDSNNP